MRKKDVWRRRNERGKRKSKGRGGKEEEKLIRLKTG